MASFKNEGIHEGSLNRVEVDIAPTKFGALELQQIEKAMKAAANFAE